MNGIQVYILTNNYMTLTINLLNARMRDIENKLKRLSNWEYNLRCPDQVRTTLWIILVKLEMEKYDVQNG